MRQSVRTLALALLCTACSEPPITIADDSTGDGDGDASTDTESGDDDGDNTNACGCADGQLCVADCQEGSIGLPPSPDTALNPRCIDDAICLEHGFDSPECMEFACNAPWSEPQIGCGDAVGYDFICEEFATPWSCDSVEQDCPELEKCVPRLPDRWGYSTARCVPVVDIGAPGEPCTSEGADPAVTGSDSCDYTSVCWSGALTAEPFEGICLPFCESSEELSCPEGFTCELLFPEDPAYYRLCVPIP